MSVCCSTGVMKRLGVIGGLGTAESNDFCLAVSNSVRALRSVQADICLEHLPISVVEEEKFIRGEVTEEHRLLLRKAVQRLNLVEVDVIAIPCNTVHIFLDELRALSRAPIVSIVEESVKECQKRVIRKVGLLASTRTIQDRLFEQEFQQGKIQTLCPDVQSQDQVSNIIIKTLNGTSTIPDRKFLLSLIHTLQQQQCEAIILGCTNFSTLLSGEDSRLPIIDTQKILQQATVEILLS